MKFEISAHSDKPAGRIRQENEEAIPAAELARRHPRIFKGCGLTPPQAEPA